MTYSPDMYIKSTHYPNDIRVELTGTKGIIWFRLSPGNVTMSAPLQMYRDGRLFSFGEVSEDWAQNFHRTTRNFVDKVRGEGKLVMSPEAGRELLRLTLAARESSPRH
jgi:predicted dehydrogenase